MSNLFNSNIIKGKLSQLKGFAQTKWGKLMGDNSHTVAGELKEVAGLARQKVGEAQDSVRRGIDKNVAKIGLQSDEDVSTLEPKQ